MFIPNCKRVKQAFTWGKAIRLLSYYVLYTTRMCVCQPQLSYTTGRTLCNILTEPLYMY